MIMNNGTVDFQIKDGIGTLSFEHPAANSLPLALLNTLAEKLQELDHRADVKAIVLTSLGTGAFCAGASLKELKSITSLNDAETFFLGFATLINTIRKLQKMVIARVHGKIVGGGVGLVSCCDYAIATTVASIKLSELSIGLGPYVIEPAVSRKMGTNAFAQLSLDCHTWKSAEWGLHKKLYNHVVKSEKELDSLIAETALRFASYDAEAIKTLRQLLWKDTAHWETLLTKNAKITARLALGNATQKILKSLSI